MPQKPGCLAWWILAEMSLVRQAGIKLFFHKVLFKVLQKRVSICVLVASLLQRVWTWAANGQCFSWMACSWQALLEQQPPLSSLEEPWLCYWAARPEKIKILMENFLEDWNCSCTSVLLWKRYYVLKSWNIVGGESARSSPKIRERLNERTWVSSELHGLKSQIPCSPFTERTEVRLCQRQLSWYPLARSWYRCPTSSNFTLMWKTKICSDSVQLASHSEATREDVWFSI